MNSDIKVKVAVKSPHWDNYPADKWLVSTNSFTIGQFWEHEVELQFVDGCILPFSDIDWSTDEVLYLRYAGLTDDDDKEVYELDLVRTELGILVVEWSDFGWYLVDKEAGYRRELSKKRSIRVVGSSLEYQDGTSIKRRIIDKDYRTKAGARVANDTLDWAENFLNGEPLGTRHVLPLFIEDCEFELSLKPVAVGEATHKMLEKRLKEREISKLQKEIDSL